MTDPSRLLAETLLNTGEAATLLNTTRRSVLRWMTTGVRVAGGRLVRLDGLRVGTLWMTSREACRRFVAATTNPTAGPPDQPPARRTSPVAKKVLSKWGVK